MTHLRSASTAAGWLPWLSSSSCCVLPSLPSPTPVVSEPRMKITATIITLNEERNIARSIESLRCCDEIVVVDSGSIDRTMELAAKLGARVVESPWHGYAPQKNYAADQATHDWILALDADEALSESLEGEIWTLRKKGPSYDA